MELIIATVILMMAAYSMLGELGTYLNGDYTSHSFDRNLFAAKGLKFNFFINYYIPFNLMYLSVYGSVIWVCCSLPDKYIAQQKWDKAFLTILAGWAVFWALLVFIDCLKRPYRDNYLAVFMYREIGTASGIFSLILAYEVIKSLIIWLVKQGALKYETKVSPIVFEIIWFIVLWGVSMFILILFHAYWGITAFTGFVVPCAFLVYLVFVYWLLPSYYDKVAINIFWLLTALVTLVISLPFNSIYASQASHRFLYSTALFVLLFVIQLVTVIPVGFIVYRARKKRAAELTGLHTALGTSNANLQYLRSQINPHFLFNALNTLYGTALMEKAEKTGEGIQKLGDMMRFMLHENNQDKIALSRELEYIHNYIDLQNMRLALSPEITIDIQIEDMIGYDEIAPMLLIPFIENAYKHGISLQERSWINVNLYKKENTLHLDVHNSVHQVNINDPERYHSGTGLDNVKQRLQLLYPGKHELMVRQNAKEFFIHLSLILNQQKPS